ncbi:hypothetical protein NRB_28440 [Novosphingobium sp. 11B]
MAALKVHGGNFRSGQGSYLWGSLNLPKEGTFLATETISVSKLIDVQVATEESIRKWGSAIGFGIGGALLLGPVGLLAGVLGGKRKEVTFVATLDDGRGFIATSDAEVFAKLKGASLKTSRQHKPAPAVAAAPPPAPATPKYKPAIVTDDSVFSRVVMALSGTGWGVNEHPDLGRHKILTAQKEGAIIVVAVTTGILTPASVDMVASAIEKMGQFSAKIYMGQSVGYGSEKDAQKRGLIIGDRADANVLIATVLKNIR